MNNKKNNENNNDNQGLKNTEWFAKFFDLSPRRVQQLTKEGIIPAAKKTHQDGNLYELIPTIKRYITYLQEALSKRSKSTEEQEKAKLEAEIKYKEAKAEYANLELGELKGKMHRAEDVAALIEDLAATTKSLLSGLPGRLALDVINKQTPAEVSVVIEDAINEILNTLADYNYNPDFFRERVAEREGWTIDEQEEYE